MSKRNYVLFVEDILQNIDKINKYINNLSYDEFLDDDKTKDAVIKNLIEIGEAANHIPENVLEQYNEVPWQQMIGFRNRLIHGYFVIDYEIVWTIIKEELPILFENLENIKRNK